MVHNFDGGYGLKYQSDLRVRQFKETWLATAISVFHTSAVGPEVVTDLKPSSPKHCMPLGGTLTIQLGVPIARMPDVLARM